MKKLITLIAASLISFGAFAFNHGIMVGVDYSPSIVKYTYLSETLTYRVNFTDIFGIDAGVRFMENFIPVENESIAYITPLLNIYAGPWYLGGGCQITPGLPIDNGLFTPYARTGFMFPNIRISRGTFRVNTGIEFSPTLINATPTDDSPSAALGAGLASAIGSIINCVKLNLGVSYYFPLGGV